jgi:hypothetical protein
MRQRSTSLGVALLALLVAGCAGWPRVDDPAAYQRALVYGSERYFALDWGPGERWGRPTVTGHIENVWNFPTWDIRLKVESLDAQGNVTRAIVGYVHGHLHVGTRAYFEVFVPERAPAYRVSVLTFNWSTGAHGNQREN